MACPPPSETIALDDADSDSDHEAEDDDEEDELDGDAGAAGEGEELEAGSDDDSDLLLDSDDEDDDTTTQPSAGGRPDEGGGDPAAVPKERVTSEQRAATEVFVGGLAVEATEEDVTATFSVAGDIAEVRMMRDRDTGLGKGFAFVRYLDAEAATTAVEHLDGIEVCGRAVGVVRSQANTRLFVAGFPRDWLDDELSAALKQAQLRSVEEVQVALDPAAPAGHQGKGHAIVRFSSHSAAMFAMNALTRRGLSLGSVRSRRIKAEWAREAPSPEALEHVTTLLVTRLPPDWDADKLRALCEPYGAVVHVAHPTSMRQPQKQTDFGYVCFEDRPSAERAQAALHGMHLGGDGYGSHTLEAAFARPRQDKEHAGGGGAARGGRGGRSEGRGGRGGGRGRRDFDGGRGRHPGRGGGGHSREHGERPARVSAPGGDSGPASLGRLVDAIKANTPAAAASAQHVPPAQHQEHRQPGGPPRDSDRHGSAPGRGKRDGGARHPSGRGSSGGGGGGGGGGRGGAKRPRVDGGGRGGGRPPLLQAPGQQAMAAMPAQQQGGYHHPYAHHQQQQQQYAAMMQHQAHAQAAMAQHYASMVGMPPHAHALMMQHAAAAAMAAMQANQQQQWYGGGGWVAQPQQAPGPQGAPPAHQPPYGAQQ